MRFGLKQKKLTVLKQPIFHLGQMLFSILDLGLIKHYLEARLRTQLAQQAQR